MNTKNIICNVQNCSHNNSNHCCANMVSVIGGNATNSSNTCCASFLDKRTYSTLTNNVNGNNLCDCLICNASNCKHNKDTNCTLDSINVNGDEVNLYSQTNCSSFKNK